MPYASGLSGQIGVVTAPSYGDSATAVTRFYEFLSESLTFDPNWLDSAGLKVNQAFKRASRTRQSAFTAAGDVVMEHTDGSAPSATADSMGFWWKHALSSSVTTPTQISASTAYKQIHTPGSHAGLYMTAQVGRPQISGVTVQPHTYTGGKVTGWEFSCSDQQIAQFKATLECQTESTSVALAAASYPAPNSLFSFSDATLFKLGGTVSTASGETSISGGVQVGTLVSGLTITGATPMKTDRYGLGSAGLKGEPIENAIPTITGTLNGEYYSRAEFYDVFKAGTTTAMQIDFSHGDAGSSNPYLLSFIFPAVKFKTAGVNVSGPDVLAQTIGFEAYDDGSGSNPVIQVKIVSKEAVAI